MDEYIQDLFEEIEKDDRLYYDYVSTVLQNKTEELICILGSGPDEIKNKLIEFFRKKIDSSKPNKTVWYYSVIISITRDIQDIIKFQCFINESDKLSLNTKYFLYYQIKAKVFSNFKKDYKEQLQIRWTLFRTIVEQYRRLFSEKLEYIKEEDRNAAFVLILTEQYLFETHGPTKTAMDRALTIIKMLGKKVLLINTAEAISTVGYMPYRECVKGNYISDFKEREFVEWKGTKIPYFQCEQDMPNTPTIGLLLDLVKEKKPQFVINIGTSSIVASLMAMMVPVISVGLGPSSLDATETTYQTLGRKLNDSDRDILRYVGKNEMHVIEGLFTSGLKSQSSTLTRSELGLPTDSFVVCVIGGRLANEIDDKFLGMLDSVIRENENIEIAVAGSYNDWENKVSRYSDLKHNFKYAGHQDDILAFLDNCDLYINPTRSGGGTSAAEALSKGVPVITTRYGDVYVGAGEEFAVNDYSEMEQQILRYQADKDYYDQKSTAARERAARLLDSDTAFLNILEEMAHREGMDL